MALELPKPRFSCTWVLLASIAMAGIAPGSFRPQPALAGPSWEPSRRTETAADRERKKLEAEYRKQGERQIQMRQRQYLQQQRATERRLKALQSSKPVPADKPPAGKPPAATAEPKRGFWSSLLRKDRDAQSKPTAVDIRRKEAWTWADHAKRRQKAEDNLRRAQDNAARVAASGSPPPPNATGTAPRARKGFWSWLSFGGKQDQSRKQKADAADLLSNGKQ